MDRVQKCKKALSFLMTLFTLDFSLVILSTLYDILIHGRAVIVENNTILLYAELYVVAFVVCLSLLSAILWIKEKD